MTAKATGAGRAIQAAALRPRRIMTVLEIDRAELEVTEGAFQPITSTARTAVSN